MGQDNGGKESFSYHGSGKLRDGNHIVSAERYWHNQSYKNRITILLNDEWNAWDGKAPSKQAMTLLREIDSILRSTLAEIK